MVVPAIEFLWLSYIRKLKHENVWKSSFEVFLNSLTLIFHISKNIYLMVLVEHRCNFFSIETNGQECFLVVVSGDVEDKHISSSKRACEDAGFVIHTTAIVGRATLKHK